MRKMLVKLSMVVSLALSLSAANLQMISDNELESVSAQGFSLNFQTFDAAMKQLSALNGGQIAIRPKIGNIVDSVVISGNAQQNAFAPINASNSAVNQAINIVIVMNSKVHGGVNINNLMGALSLSR